MAESELHSALKSFCAQPGDRFEVNVEGYFVDVLRGNLLIEIQTGSFHHLKPKLFALLENHPIRIVYPIAVGRWIEKRSAEDNQLIERRKSPKIGRIEQIFTEMDSFPGLILHPNLEIQVVLINDVVVRINDGKGSWRRKGWRTIDRRIESILSEKVFSKPEDFLELLPQGLPAVFSRRELAVAMKAPLLTAQKMVYCLHRMGMLSITRKHGRTLYYSVNLPG
ncbi:MAG TPA: hypothetical protein VIO61_10900 [Anaerolineaceae bacterium]